MASQRGGGGYKQVKAEVQTIRAQIKLSQRNFQDARAAAAEVLEMTEASYKELAVDATCTLCLAQALSGSAAEGRPLCERAVETASGMVESYRLSLAMLALARAQLESGDAQAALSSALQAQERFNRAGQRDSEWQAWLVASLANRRRGEEKIAEEQSARASEALAELGQKWGATDFNRYLERRDIQFSQKQLGGGSVAAVIKTSLNQRRKSQ
jgi:ATP/maltotriose-dependent transcriptional regulator MalT